MYPQPTYLTAPPDGVIRKGKMPVRAQYQMPTSYSGLQHNPAYGTVGKVALLGAGAAGLIGLVLLPSLVVYPWVIGKFKPKWSYGKRVGAGFAIGIGTSLIKSALTPPEVKLAREQERIAAAAERKALKGSPPYGGWLSRKLFGSSDWKADWEQQIEWAEAQVNLAKSGAALTSIYGPGCCTTGGGDITASSFTQSPTSYGGMLTRSAYWIALTARVAMGAGWSQAAVQDLIKEAEKSLAVSKKSWNGSEDPGPIIEGFQMDIDQINSHVPHNPPLPDYKTIVQRLATMGSIESIKFSQAQDINIIGGGLKGTWDDIVYKVGVGDGGAVVRNEEKEKEEAAKKRDDMQPFLIVGGIALAAGIGYAFFKKD